jgi:hypothetical protein
VLQEIKLERLVKLGNMALLMRMLRPPKQLLLSTEIVDAVSSSGTKVAAAEDMAVLAQMAGPLVDAQLPSSDAVCYFLSYLSMLRRCSAFVSQSIANSHRLLYDEYLCEK